MAKMANGFVAADERLMAITTACRETGWCPTCKCRRAKEGRKTCQVCLHRARDRRRAWRKAKLCVDCRVKSKTRRCLECQRKHQAKRDWAAARAVFSVGRDD